MVAGEPAVWEKTRPPEQKKEMEKQNGCIKASKGIHVLIHRSLSNRKLRRKRWQTGSYSLCLCLSVSLTVCSTVMDTQLQFLGTTRFLAPTFLELLYFQSQFRPDQGGPTTDRNWSYSCCHKPICVHTLYILSPLSSSPPTPVPTSFMAFLSP